MRDVDEALAHVYGTPRPTTHDHPLVPPAPHVVPDRSPDAPVLTWPATVLTLERRYGDRFARLADALIEARDRRHVRLILFTSCHRAEGRTTLVLTLARALARWPGVGRLLLADADLAGPMLTRLLGFRPAVGLDDVIERGDALADALVAVPADRLSLLPLRAAVTDARGFFAGAAWSVVAARLRREFDLVLLDGGPLLSGLAADVPHRAVDAAVLVRNTALTGDRAVARARDALEAAGVPLLGVAETFAARGQGDSNRK